jgi:hypothetical protein
MTKHSYGYFLKMDLFCVIFAKQLIKEELRCMKKIPILYF